MSGLPPSARRSSTLMILNPEGLSNSLSPSTRREDESFLPDGDWVDAEPDVEAEAMSSRTDWAVTLDERRPGRWDFWWTWSEDCFCFPCVFFFEGWGLAPNRRRTRLALALASIKYLFFLVSSFVLGFVDSSNMFSTARARPIISFLAANQKDA